MGKSTVLTTYEILFEAVEEVCSKWNLGSLENKSIHEEDCTEIMDGHYGDFLDDLAVAIFRITDNLQMNEHRWSGWPGAWCLDCGISDPIEQCVADGDADAYCTACKEFWPQGICFANTEGDWHTIENMTCEKHVLEPCPEPMSHNHDPYYLVEQDTNRSAPQADIA